MFILQPKSQEDFAANVRGARVSAGRPIGINLSTGSAAEFRALSQADQVRLTDETAAFIVANPSLFSGGQLDIARKRVGSSLFRVPLEGAPDLLDNAAAFVRAYGETFGETVVGAAGIAGRSAAALGIRPGVVLTVAAVAAVLYFGAPFVLPRLKAAFSK